MNTVQQLLLKGAQSFTQGDFDAAIRACDVALRQQQDCSDAYLLRGKAFYGKEYFGPSIRDSRIVLKLAPRNEEARDLLLQAEGLKQKIVEECKAVTEIQGFQVLMFLGFGWEGSVYLVRDIDGRKHILKRFYEHRVEKLNSETIGFYRTPVVGGAVHLQRLAECSQSHPSAYMYPLSLLWRDADIVGLVYQYEKLINISRRYVVSADLKLCLVKALFEIQGYLLRHLDLVMVDASIGQFMITRLGRLKFVDYGESINPVNDFRCQEEHWQIVTLIKFLYQLFKPQMQVHFKPTDFSMVGNPEQGLGDLIDTYPFIESIIDRLQQSDFAAFSDFRFYTMLGASLPEKLSYSTLGKIHLDPRRFVPF